MVRTGGKQLVVNHPNGPDFLCSEQSEDASKGWSLLAYRLYVTVHAKTNDKSANFFFLLRSDSEYTVSQAPMYIVILESIALTTPEIRLRECTLVSGSRFSKTQCLG